MTSSQSRINMRISTDALDQIRDAARLQGQDVTAFVLGAAMTSARQVLLEDRVLTMTPSEVLQLERALDSDSVPSKRLAEAVQRHAEAVRPA